MERLEYTYDQPKIYKWIKFRHKITFKELIRN